MSSKKTKYDVEEKKKKKKSSYNVEKKSRNMISRKKVEI